MFLTIAIMMVNMLLAEQLSRTNKMAYAKSHS